MGNGKTPRGRHRDDGRAIGEAQHGRNVGRGDHKGIGGGLRTLLGRHDAGGVARVDADDVRAVHLVGHDDRNTFAIERLHGKAAVFHDMIEVVLHVGTKVQRGERPLACSPIATGEGDADAARLEQRIIGEHGNATRAAGARVECRCR